MKVSMVAAEDAAEADFSVAIVVAVAVEAVAAVENVEPAVVVQLLLWAK